MENTCHVFSLCCWQRWLTQFLDPCWTTSWNNLALRNFLSGEFCACCVCMCTQEGASCTPVPVSTSLVVCGMGSCNSVLVLQYKQCFYHVDLMCKCFSFLSTTQHTVNLLFVEHAVLMLHQLLLFYWLTTVWGCFEFKLWCMLVVVVSFVILLLHYYCSCWECVTV